MFRRTIPAESLTARACRRNLAWLGVVPISLGEDVWNHCAWRTEGGLMKFFFPTSSVFFLFFAKLTFRFSKSKDDGSARTLHLLWNSVLSRPSTSRCFPISQTLATLTTTPHGSCSCRNGSRRRRHLHWQYTRGSQCQLQLGAHPYWSKTTKFVCQNTLRGLQGANIVRSRSE